MYEFDVSLRFLTKLRSPVSHVLPTVQNTHRRALLFINNRQFIGFLHKQNKAASTEKVLGLDETSSVDYNSEKLKPAVIFFYFSVTIYSGEILASVWQEEANSELLKRCYIPANN